MSARKLAVSWGGGVDSTAILVEFARRGIRPDFIHFADTGAEKPETLAYVWTFAQWLIDHDMPAPTVVFHSKKWANLEASCVGNGTLPSLAFGGHSCSDKYKRAPLDKWFNRNASARAEWAAGRKVVKVLGYEATETKRTFRVANKIDPKYDYWYPLQEWGWDRARCIAEIRAAGLPVPMKSACFFCPASKKSEVDWLADNHPELLARALLMEQKALPKLGSSKGLGRRWNWGEYLAARALACRIDNQDTNQQIGAGLQGSTSAPTGTPS